MIRTKDISIRLDQMLLDPNNYRLTGEKDSKAVLDSKATAFQSNILDQLESQKIDELKDSIRIHGFLEMERIVVRVLDVEGNVGLEDDDNNKKYLVVEGNRRTAALKSLKQDGFAPFDDDSKKINVILVTGSTQDIKDYSATLMGIRHVSGPKKWDGFQSAKLINDLRSENKSFTRIGEILGISSREAARRYRGFKAFQQMKGSDFKDKVEARHYGLLLEFLPASKRGREWLEWNDTTYKFEQPTNLNRLYKAITRGDDGDLEIKNPADARKFVALLDTKYVVDIEAGTSIQLLPDPEYLKDTGKLRRINQFIKFVDTNSFNEEEMTCLSDLATTVNGMLEG